MSDLHPDPPWFIIWYVRRASRTPLQGNNDTECHRQFARPNRRVRRVNSRVKVQLHTHHYLDPVLYPSARSVGIMGLASAIERRGDHASHEWAPALAHRSREARTFLLRLASPSQLPLGPVRLRRSFPFNFNNVPSPFPGLSLFPVSCPVKISCDLTLDPMGVQAVERLWVGSHQCTLVYRTDFGRSPETAETCQIRLRTSYQGQI